MGGNVNHPKERGQVPGHMDYGHDMETDHLHYHPEAVMDIPPQHTARFMIEDRERDGMN